MLTIALTAVNCVLSQNDDQKKEISMNVGMKSGRYTLLVAGLVTSFYTVHPTNYQQKTFLRTRVAGSEDLVLKNSLWMPNHRDDQDGRRRGGHHLNVSGFFSESVNADDVGAYFGVNGSNQITVGNRVAGLGTQLRATDRDVDGYRLVRQDQGLPVRIPQIPTGAPGGAPNFVANPRYNPAAFPVQGRLMLRPKQTAVGVRIDYHHDLSNWIDGLFITASLPIVQVERELNPMFDLQNNADMGNGTAWTLEDFFAGRLDNSQENNAESYNNGIAARTILNDLQNFPGGTRAFDVTTAAGLQGSVIRLWENLGQNVFLPGVNFPATDPNPDLAPGGTAVLDPFGNPPVAQVLGAANINEFFRALSAKFDEGIVSVGENIIRVVDDPIFPDPAPATAENYITQQLFANPPAPVPAPGIADVSKPVGDWATELERVGARVPEIIAANATNPAVDAVTVAAPQGQNANALFDLLDAAMVNIIEPRSDQLTAFNQLVATTDDTRNRDQLKPLAKAKMVKKRKKTHIADIDLAIGYHLVSDADRSVSVNLGLTIPTTGRPRGNYLFEPVVGNGGHVALTAGLDGHYHLLSGDRGHVWVNTHWQYKYLLSAKESRTLGMVLNGDTVPFGHYFGVGFVNTTAPLFPAANELTRNVRVRPGSQLEGVVSLSFHGKGMMLDLGYNLHWKDQERVGLPSAAQKALSTLRLPNLNPDASTLVALSPTSFNTTRALDATNSVALSVDTNTARAQSSLTHRFYTGLGYRFSRCGKRSLCVSVGASYELPHSNNALEVYQVWGKFGLLF